MADSILYYKFSNTDQSLTGNFFFNQAAADDQQVTLEEGLNISATYDGQTYTQADNSLALLFTNESGEIADQGLGLQFVISGVFTVNADIFFDANTDNSITYTPIYAPTDLVFNTIYNFSNTDQSFTGSLSFNQAAADDQQITLDEGLNISATYSGQTYTQADDSLALLLTNQLGEIADQGLGLQFVIPDVFTVNADLFFDANTDLAIAYTLAQTPTNPELSAISVDENIASETIVASFSTTDEDSSTFIYTLVAGDGDTDNTAFTIDSSNLKINSSPNFEAKSSYSIRVRTTDNDGFFLEKALAIAVNDLNEAPTDLSLGVITVDENVSANTIIGTFSSTDPDANNTFIYTLVAGDGDTDNSAFTIDGGNLKINSSPNFEAKSSYNIRVRTTDSDGLFVEKSLAIAVNDLNEAPTDLSLGVITVDENVSANTIIGTFSSTDPDANNTFTYSLVAGIDDTDNAVFTINGNKLQINTFPTYDIKSSYKIRVRTTDQNGLFFEKILNIGVKNVVIPAQLAKVSDDVFNIKGDNGKGILKITITSSTPNANQLSELGIFNVEDAAGTVKDETGKSLLPGADGYAKAALARAKVLLSTIANLPNGFSNSDVVRSLQLDFDSNLRFYLVQGTTTQTVINKSSYSDVVFSSTQNIKDLGNNTFSLNFPNLVVNIQPTNESLDSGLSNQFGQQGSTQGELLYVNDNVNATFTVNREAAYDNFIGFYQVTDETGTINVNGTIYKPGDSGYTQAAINSRVVGLTGSNQATIASNGKFSSNSIFAPFIIANGDPSTYINRGNSVYFSFLSANPTNDKQVDHIRLLGNNTFGFEDLPNGGDQDFNDIIVRVNFS